MTLQEFIKSRNIRMTVEHWHENPNMDQDGWHDQADHWKCTLKRNRKTLTVYFSMGSGHRGRKPELAEVLDSLASDAAGYENARDFEDWASEYGYDPDSRKAERDYNTANARPVSSPAFSETKTTRNFSGAWTGSSLTLC